MTTEPPQSRSPAAMPFAAIFLLVGLMAFVAPLHHEGPYSIPGRGLIGGLGCLAIAAVIVSTDLPRWAHGLALLAMPFALFLALYGALAEIEEVVVLETPQADLRLWVVDHDGAEWVSMSRAKAERYVLDGERFELLRRGKTRCVATTLADDEESVQRTFDLRQQKYAVQRLAVAIGFFSDQPQPDSVTLRLDPCD